MRKFFLLLSLMLFSAFSSAEYKYYSKRHMAQISDLIVVGTVKFIEKGSFNGYNQKVYFEVEKHIKGSSFKNIVIFGSTDSECCMTKFTNGRYFLFLEKRENRIFEYGIEPTFISANYFNGIHKVNDNKIWWKSEKVDSQVGLNTDLDFVVSEVGEFSKVPWNNNIY